MIRIEELAIPAVCVCGACPEFGRGSPYQRELRISCYCPDCYDGTEDAGAKSHIVGYGSAEQTALESFWDGVAEEWEVN